MAAAMVGDTTEPDQDMQGQGLEKRSRSRLVLARPFAAKTKMPDPEGARMGYLDCTGYAVTPFVPRKRQLVFLFRIPLSLLCVPVSCL